MASDADYLALAHSNLLAYVRLQFPGYKIGNHHRKIADALMAVERGEIKRLVIQAPARHGKSLLTSEYFPAWYLGRNPDKYVITATYGQELADDFGRKVRNQMRSPEHQASFPNCKLAEDSQSASRFGTDQGGSYFALGVGGSATGRGANCIPEGTMVKTLCGDVAIEDLKMNTASGIILTYSMDTERLEFKKLQATQSRHASELFRFTTASGRVVEATGNHLIFANGCWKTADSVAEGDSVVCVMREGNDSSSLRIHESSAERPQGFLLQSEMLSGASCYKEREALQEVREVYCSERRLQECEILQDLRTKKSWSQSGSSGDRKGVSNLQCNVSRKVAWSKAREACGVLLKALRGDWSFKADGKREQSEVEERRNSASSAAAFSKGIPSHEESYSGSGSSCVRSVRSNGAEARGSSHRQLADEQFSVESGNAMLLLSPEMARCDGFKAFSDVVARIDRVCKETRVFDIQVEGNNNFFAGGVLVHNCLIIDDPIKGREEADSETYRKRLKDWYASVAYTRLMPGGAIIIMNTRWHEEDLTGWVLAEHTHENWTVIDLPALDDKGNALWPEQYDEEALARIKLTIGQREWQALYMQRPAPDTGDYFKREWFKSYDRAPKHLRIYGASDYAVTADDGDYTEHGVFGLDPEGELYMLDWWSGQTTSDVWIETQLDLIDKWKPQAWVGESGPIRRSVEPFLTRRMKERRSLCRLDWLPSVNDKPTRCRAFQAIAASGMFYMPMKEDYAQRLLRQMLTFPVGVFDDAVDVCSLIGRFIDQMRDARIPKDRAKPIKVGTFDHLLKITDDVKPASKYRSIRS